MFAVEVSRPADRSSIHPAWWTLVLFTVITLLATLSLASYDRVFRKYIAVTLTSDRAGLLMETGSKVKLRGVQVGRVGGIDGGRKPATLRLEIDPAQVRFIPANIEAEIKATTAFGGKYVDLIYPNHPSPHLLTAGQEVRSRNVSTEVNTVFQNLVDVLHKIDPTKLNSVLTALADGLRGQAAAVGTAITDATQVLDAINPRAESLRADWQALKGFSDAYGGAAADLLRTLDAATRTSTTLTSQRAALNALLLNVIGFATEGSNLLEPNKSNLIEAVNTARPTTELLYKYNPVYTCMLVGGKWFLDNDGYEGAGGNGRTSILDVAMQLGKDMYRYPQNLPIVAAKGGPGGKPGCGSLPIADKNWPVRALITNTGWGTGLDYRPNPGIGFPGFANYFPTTKTPPQDPILRHEGRPAPGPIPYPGAPPHGAPLYGPDGAPLYPGVPAP